MSLTPALTGALRALWAWALRASRCPEATVWALMSSVVWALAWVVATGPACAQGPRGAPEHPVAGALTVALASASAPHAGLGGAPVVRPQRIERAEFIAAGGASAQPVDLPDTWAQRGLPVQGQARYRLSFTLDAVPAEPMALRFARISSTRRVWLNGQLIETESPGGRDHPVPAVIALPDQKLRAGRNELVVELRYRSRAGLSQAELGAASTLVSQDEYEAVWTRELPRSLNMGMLVLAVFMLLVWRRRPGEQTMGLFGLLAMIGSVRNYTYFADVTLMPSALTDWLFFAAQVWTAALFSAFARSLHPPRRLGLFDRSVRWLAWLAPLLAAAVMPWSLMPWMRTLTYPWLLVLAAVAVWRVTQAARVRADALHRTLVVSFVVVLVAGLHDYAFQQGYLPVTGTFWMPFVMPFALGVYGLLLMGRLIRALGEVEQLNVELEHRVQQRTLALQSANAAKTRFLASASHDLRQPVAAMGLLVSLLREQAQQPGMRMMIDRVDEALAAMESMLKGLLDLSRLESGTVRARPQRVALQPLFDAIALHESDAALRKGLRLRFRPTRLAVESDPVLLEQMLRNLVSNALRYTERGGVLVAARQRGRDELMLQVWDSGVGIAPEDQASVFEEFVQLGNAARQRAQGLGLGLSIVRRCATVLGHPLSLRSTPGRGSCFALRLPRAADEPAAPGVRRMARTAEPLAGLRLVVVEDDAAVRESLALRLTHWGAQVQAFDGVPALRVALPPLGSARDGRFCDLLLTDQRLPGGSGLLVIELVRQHCGATRAMVVTGDTSPGDLSLLAASGVPVLHKPFRAEDLLATIEQALQSTALGVLPG